MELSPELEDLFFNFAKPLDLPDDYLFYTEPMGNVHLKCEQSDGASICSSLIPPHQGKGRGESQYPDPVSEVMVTSTS